MFPARPVSRPAAMEPGGLRFRLPPTGLQDCSKFARLLRSKIAVIPTDRKERTWTGRQRRTCRPRTLEMDSISLRGRCPPESTAWDSYPLRGIRPHHAFGKKDFQSCFPKRLDLNFMLSNPHSSVCRFVNDVLHIRKAR